MSKRVYKKGDILMIGDNKAQVTQPLLIIGEIWLAMPVLREEGFVIVEFSVPIEVADTFQVKWMQPTETTV